MVQTTNNRRRNLRPDYCRVCGVAVPAEAGWLYSDTRSSNSRSYRLGTGRWLKFVKCDRCHTLGAHKNDLPENKPAKGPDRVSVTEIRKARLMPSLEADERHHRMEPCVRLVLEDGTSEVVVAPYPIDGRPSAQPAYHLSHCRLVFGGRELTPAATDLVEQRAEAAAIEFAAHVGG